MIVRAATAGAFCRDLRTRFAGRVQITSDGLAAYKWALGAAFPDGGVDFAQLVKIYGKDENGRDVVIRIDKVPVFGTPDINLVSTSYVERSNLTVRMANRRFTRLTNAFSKKIENHCHMLAVTFMHYNFCRRHTTLKTTPAVAAGIADHVWTLEQVVEIVDAHIAAKEEAMFEAAFAGRQIAPPLQMKLTRPYTTPKTYPPQTPKVPWYLDPNSGGNPGPNNFNN